MPDIDAIIVAFVDTAAKQILLRCPDHAPAPPGTKSHPLCAGPDGVVRCCGGKCDCKPEWTVTSRQGRVVLVRTGSPLYERVMKQAGAAPPHTHGPPAS